MNARVHLLTVWMAVAAIAAAIFITYAVLPASEFYHVSREGLAGGASRALVFSNFPTALVALATIGVSLALLLPSAGDGRRRLILIGSIGALLCLVTAVPGVVDQANLDAKAVNIVPLIGVVIALSLTAKALRSAGRRLVTPMTGRDRFGRWLVGILAILAMPWVLADIGVYVGDLPLLGSIFYSKQIPEGETLRAVHLGHHHGLDGLLFVFVAFTLGRVVRELRGSRLASVTAAYLGLMLAYGIANYANDFWLEQVVKRGWVAWEIPSFLRPELSVGWALILVGAVVSWVVFFRPASARSPSIETGAAAVSAGAPR